MSSKNRRKPAPMIAGLALLAALAVPLFSAASSKASQNNTNAELSEADREASASESSLAKLSENQILLVESMLQSEIQRVVDNQRRIDGQEKKIRVKSVVFDQRTEGVFLVIDLSKGYVPSMYGGVEIEELQDEITSAAFDMMSKVIPITGVDLVYDGKDILYYYPGQARKIEGMRNLKPLAAAGSICVASYEPVVVSPGHGMYYHHGYKDWRFQRDSANGIIEDLLTLDYAWDLLGEIDPFGQTFLSCNNTRTGTYWWGVHGASGRPWRDIAARYSLQNKYPNRPDIWHSRPTDTSSLREYNEDVNSRPLFANAVSGVKSLIHLHTNASTNTAARGAQVYYHSGRTADQKLGNDILCGMKEIIHTSQAYKSYLVETQARAVTNKGENILAKMPSIIVEIGFHTNPSDAAALKDPAFRVLATKGMAKGYKLNRQGKTCKPFRITSVPSASGKQKTTFQLKVHYDGYPKFPVTAATQVVTCPPGTSCSTSTQTYSADAPSPLSKSFTCGAFTSTTTAKWRITLTDADGVKTPPVEYSVTCTV